MINSDQFHHVINVIGYRFYVGVQLGVLFAKLLNEWFGGCIRILEAGFFQDIVEFIALFVVVFRDFGVQKGRAKIDLDDAAIFTQSL